MHSMDHHYQVWNAIGWQIPVDFQNPDAVMAVLRDLWKYSQTIRLRAARMLPGQRPQFELYLGHSALQDSADGE